RTDSASRGKAGCQLTFHPDHSMGADQAAITINAAAPRSGSRAPTTPRPTLPSGAPATAVPGLANSVVAFDATSGAIKGHFQYHPNDSWDWDEVSPPIVLDYQRNGRTVKGLVNVARDGYLWQLERTNDKINFIAGQPYVRQNVFKSLDPK